jgi:hypothetical protein
LSAADAALIKGMLSCGDRQHDIAAWFGVNGGRVAAQALAAIESLALAKSALAEAETTIRRFAKG